MTGHATRIAEVTAISAALLIASGCSVGGGSERPTTVTQTVQAPHSEPGPAEGDPAGPRLEGAWEVRRTVQRSNEYRDGVGDTSSGRWRFEPQCPRGACDVRLTLTDRPRPAREVTLKPRGSFLSGTVRYPDTAVCINGRNRVLKGADSEDRISLEVTATDPSGRATAFRGRSTTRSTPNYSRLRGTSCIIAPSFLDPVVWGLKGKTGQGRRATSR